jgi:hypothetical protein
VRGRRKREGGRDTGGTATEKEKLWKWEDGRGRKGADLNK